jgi:hypothetical protein
LLLLEQHRSKHLRHAVDLSIKVTQLKMKTNDSVTGFGYVLTFGLLFESPTIFSGAGDAAKGNIL